MRKTKIVCTLGPASSNEAVLKKMLNAGMNIARFNFSHGTHEGHKEMIDTFRKVRDEIGCPAAVLLDTKGPEIRICEIEGGQAVIESGHEFILTNRNIIGNSKEAQMNYPALLSHDLKPGQKILIDDGNIDLVIIDHNETDIRCKVVDGGIIKTHKSVNLPNFHLNIEFLSERDKSDILFGIENDVDFIAASFVRCADDVISLRKFLDYHGGHDIRIIAKIENSEGVRNFDEILEKSDGIMVARGDMGVEIDFEKLPGIQKKFIRKCYQAGKMVITATQMLESMQHNYMPTRAEITDVANAVFDGTSAVMLSGETTVGDHPVRVVEVMAHIVEQAEQDALELGSYRGLGHDLDHADITNAICDAACTTANDMKATAIITVTESGYTARLCSKFRPSVPIVAATPNEKTYHQLALSWGVYPVLSLYQNNAEKLLRHAVDCARMIDVVHKGDRVVITSGEAVKSSKNTNLLKVEIV